MKCLNRFCIYQEIEDCTCECEDEIEIDWRGICKNMIPARITRLKLEDSKEYTKLILRIDKDCYFDKENGLVTFDEKKVQYYNDGETYE